MNAIIVSDLHIGSRHFLLHDFQRFLENLPEDHELILNGDIINNFYIELPPSHRWILDLIKQISFHRKVVWIPGNHDIGYIPERFGYVEFKKVYTLENRVLIAHGQDFDKITSKNQTFIKAFKIMHKLRVKLGAKPVHVTQYAKKWKILYKIFRNNVMMNAVKCAIENGYKAVICGHTHFPEDRFFNGIRYINTGAWTESPAFFLQITGDKMNLKTLPE